MRRVRMSIPKGRTLRLVSLLASSLIFDVSHATDVEQGTFTLSNGLGILSVEAPRPMAKAAEILSAQYASTITYEDPRYRFGPDITDRASKFRKDYQQFPPGKAPKLLGPLGGTLSVSFSSKNLASMLQQLVGAQTQVGNGGHFQVEQTGTFFHIVPYEVRDQNGSWIAQKTLLDAPISLPTQSRGAHAVLVVICEEVANANNQGILLATDPGPDTDDSPQYTLGATQEAGRSVLVRALTAMAAQTGPLTWQLYYEVETGHYFMNFVKVPAVTATASTSSSQGTGAPQTQGANGAAVPPPKN